MLKRTAIAILWFFALWATYELVVSIAGAPRWPGPILGLLGALFWGADPLGMIYPAGASPSRDETTAQAAAGSSPTSSAAA